MPAGGCLEIKPTLILANEQRRGVDKELLLPLVTADAQQGDPTLLHEYVQRALESKISGKDQSAYRE
jgi:hypothetical protein